MKTIRINERLHTVLLAKSLKEGKSIASILDQYFIAERNLIAEYVANIPKHEIKHSYMTCRKAFFEHKKPDLTAEQIAFYSIPGNMRFFLDKRKAEYDAFKMTYMKKQRETFKERRRIANRNFYIRRSLQNDKARV